MGEKVKIYTLPDCYLCDKVKSRLKEMDVQFEEVPFDTSVQVELIMRNIFGNPPILELGSRVASSEELFDGDVLREGKLREVLGLEEE
jgi:glutaredoxin